jgi:3-hydroxybutyryl-CoA dehydrogenase
MSIERITIIGAGTMGHGIAQVFALAGFQVALTDISLETLEEAIPRIQDNLQTCVKHKIISLEDAADVPGRIMVTTDLDKAVSKTDFIIEAIIEDLETKMILLEKVDQICPIQTIIASTTSSYCVRDMIGALKLPERFLVTHFWNPPYLIPVVEVMPGETTSPQVVQTTISLLDAVGRNPVLINKDVPGFVGNRLQHALRREAISIVAQGIASPEDVDLIAKASFGLRLPVVGPLETVDLGGLDLTEAIQTYLLPDLDRSTGPLPLIRDKVARGDLGAKSGKGFYDWSPGQHEELIRRRDEILIELVILLKKSGFLE